MNVPRLLETILDTCDPRKTEGNWWEEIFVADNLVPFPTLFVEDSVPQQELRLIACRIRYGFSGTQEIDPDIWQLSDDSGEILHYSRQAVFVFSIDTAGFLCCGPPDEEFWRSTLPDHLRNHYLLVLILTLAQRTALMKISRLVASSWRAGATEQEHRDLFRAISDDLLEFTARLHFVQAFHTEHYHTAYSRLRTAFRIAQLYDEVQDEVSQMSNQLDAESEKRQIEAERRRDGAQRRIEQRHLRPQLLYLAIAVDPGALRQQIEKLARLAELEPRSDRACRDNAHSSSRSCRSVVVETCSAGKRTRAMMAA